MGAWKAGAWFVGLAGGAVFALIETPLTKETFLIGATIVALPPTITGLFGILHDRRTERKQDAAQRSLDVVGEKVDGILSKAHEGERAALTRADTAEAFTKGSDAERERGK